MKRRPYALPDWGIYMKFKLTALLVMLSLAVVLSAQTGNAGAQNPSDQGGKTCACCNHDKAHGGSATCCNGCCKDGKCPMMSGNASGHKCPMMAQDGKMASGKMCCSGNKCPMHAKGDQGKGCCCGNMAGNATSGL